MAAGGDSLIYSTYLGGLEFDTGQDIAVDNNGCAYITGFTYSDSFPTQNPLPGYGPEQGYSDIFVTKFSPVGNTLEYSTYLGGNVQDQGRGIAIDGTGAAYVTGLRNWSGPGDAFAAKLIWNESTSTLSLGYDVIFGGYNDDEGFDIAVDETGNAYITGETWSISYNTFPQVNPLSNQGPLSICAAFIMKLDVNGSIIYSTMLSGYGGDEGRSIAVDSHNNAYVTGHAAPQLSP